MVNQGEISLATSRNESNVDFGVFEVIEAWPTMSDRVNVGTRSKRSGRTAPRKRKITPKTTKSIRLVVLRNSVPKEEPIRSGYSEISHPRTSFLHRSSEMPFIYTQSHQTRAPKVDDIKRAWSIIITAFWSTVLFWYPVPPSRPLMSQNLSAIYRWICKNKNCHLKTWRTLSFMRTEILRLWVSVHAFLKKRFKLIHVGGHRNSQLLPQIQTY